MKRNSLIVLILCLIFGCQTKQKPVLINGIIYFPADTSQIIENQIIGYADTIMANISGQITDKKTEEPIIHSSVFVIDPKTEKAYGTLPDSLGNYSFWAPAGEYTFGVVIYGYDELEVPVILSSGEVRNIDVKLGRYQPKGNCVTQISKRKLKKYLKEQQQ